MGARIGLISWYCVNMVDIAFASNTAERCGVVDSTLLHFSNIYIANIEHLEHCIHGYEVQCVNLDVEDQV